MDNDDYRARLNRMMALVIEHLGSREAATRWMLNPNWRLERRSPLDCLRSEDNWPKVERALRHA